MTDPGRPFAYQVPIQRGVWERVTAMGVPRFYARAWAALWLFVGLYLLTYWGVRWLAVPFVAWLVGHGVLVLLTMWNPRFDDMLIAHLNRRYRPRYRAG